jgi:hypothetical protein
MMKSILAVILLLSLCPSVGAELIVELGSTPVIGLSGQWDSFSVGLGVDVSWRKTEVAFFDESSGRLVEEGFAVLLVEPTGFFRWFLSDDKPAQPFVVGKFSREIEAKNDLDDDRDAYSIMGGFGLRAFVSERFSVGGETGVRAQVFDGGKTVGGHFDVFVQYRP